MMFEKLSRRGLLEALLGAAGALPPGNRAKAAPPLAPRSASTTPRVAEARGWVTTSVYDARGQLVSTTGGPHAAPPLPYLNVKPAAKADPPDGAENPQGDRPAKPEADRP
jgi:hypothetical protein